MKCRYFSLCEMHKDFPSNDCCIECEKREECRTHCKQYYNVINGDECIYLKEEDNDIQGEVAVGTCDDQ